MELSQRYQALVFQLISCLYHTIPLVLVMANPSGKTKTPNLTVAILAVWVHFFMEKARNWIEKLLAGLCEKRVGKFQAGSVRRVRKPALGS
jgi:hypothetical protein